MAEHNDFGRWGEDYAAGYLQEQGYVIVERNWVFGRSSRDLDIICLTPDHTTMVFVEVKTRATDKVAEPEDAVDSSKIRHLGRAADDYVKSNGISQELRFDIITVTGRKNSKHVVINHIKDAFNPLLL